MERPAIVLVIDHDPAMRRLARERLEEAAWTVYEAVDAAAGLALMAERPADIVLLDVATPGISAFDACRRMRLLPNMEFCSVVLLTPCGDAGAIMQAYEAGATDFFSKPLDWPVLQQRLRFILKTAASLRAVLTQRIHRLANYDALTGLPNRTLLEDRMLQALARARRDGQRVALLSLDLDGFKLVNDSYGHAVGNRLLQAVAARLRAGVRAGDTVARLGGDEFVLIFPSLAEQRDVLRVAQKGWALFAAPFLVDGRELHVTASIGICLYPDDGDEMGLLFKNVDVAMYEAKEGGRNCYKFYAREMGCRVEQYVEMERALRVALELRQFEVHYQPKVHLQSGKFCGAEALVRWNHPQNGQLQPGSFVALAEKTGLIGPIGEWVLRTACAQARQWRDMGLDDMPVAVNLSAVQFGQQNMAELVSRVLADTGLPAGCLELELTESMLMSDSDSMLKALREIKAVGVTLALDDFGTGYSSLTYLKRFPIDVIKIDRGFVRNITTDPNDATLTRTIVLMAKSLKMKTVAEGVETPGQVGFLSAIQCDVVQGYYFSKPLSAAALTALLQQQADRPVLLRGPAPERTMLLLDDEPNVLAALQRIFRNDGYRILKASCALDALELLAVHPAQVVISDQRMPSMTGTTFLSKVKELYPDTIRIVLSGYMELDTVIDAINRGAVYRFYTKPWDDQQLREQVREAFEHHGRLHGRPDEQVLLGPAPPARLAEAG